MPTPIPGPFHDYSRFRARDFVLDDYFRQWVLQPDEGTMSFWHTYLLHHPQQQVDIDEAASILLHLRTNYDDLTDDGQHRIWQVLEQHAQLGGTADAGLSLTDRPVRPLLGRTLWLGWRPARVAASLTGLLVLAGAVWYVLRPSDQLVRTGFGEQVSVTLPDGSTVLLNGNSSLRYHDDWADGQPREVWLDGEAFFKVTKKVVPDGRMVPSPVKFVTHTAGLDITVLGTQFNVNTRRGTTNVTLLEGKVQLVKPNGPKPQVIEMKPGDFATAQAGIEKVEVKREKPLLHAAWVEKKFVFEDTPLRVIAQQLSDTYGLDVIFEDNDLADRRFTGNMSSQSLETLLDTIATLFDLRIERNGNQLYFRHPAATTSSPLNS